MHRKCSEDVPWIMRLTAILARNDLDAAEVFFGRLGFVRDEAGPDDYRMLSDGHGGFVHLNRAVASWLRAGVNPFGLYLCRKDVDALAAVFTGEIPEPERAER